MKPFEKWIDLSPLWGPYLHVGVGNDARINATPAFRDGIHLLRTYSYDIPSNFDFSVHHCDGCRVQVRARVGRRWVTVAFGWIARKVKPFRPDLRVNRIEGGYAVEVFPSRRAFEGAFLEGRLGDGPQGVAASHMPQGA